MLFDDNFHYFSSESFYDWVSKQKQSSIDEQTNKFAEKLVSDISCLDYETFLVQYIYLYNQFLLTNQIDKVFGRLINTLFRANTHIPKSKNPNGIKRQLMYFLFLNYLKYAKQLNPLVDSFLYNLSEQMLWPFINWYIQ